MSSIPTPAVADILNYVDGTWRKSSTSQFFDVTNPATNRAALVLCLSALGWFKRVDFRQIAVDATAWYWQAMSVVWLMLLGVLAFGQ